MAKASRSTRPISSSSVTASSSTKYSAMVLDVGAIDANDVIVVGIDQALRVDSDEWWRADLRPMAEAKVTAMPAAKPR